MAEKPGSGSDERRLQLALDLAQMSTWEWNVETGEASWSRELEVAAGTAPAGFGGTIESFLALVHPDDRGRVEGTLFEAAANARRFELEYRIVLPDGETRWRSAAGDVLAFEGGRATRMIGVGRDITARKEAEERLRQVEERNRALVEQLPLASYVEELDAESAVYISPQIADLVGYTAEEWVADPNFFATVLHPDDRDRVLAGFAAMHESGESFECEYRVIARNGSTVWIHDAAVVVRNELGRSKYAQGYMIDITQRKRDEEELRANQQRLREQMEQIEYQALHDSLTDLPNRTLFHDRAEQALRLATRQASGFTVMLIDLDRFKEINDTLGHHSGDLLLREIAGRLRRSLRASDTVARLGGDEFGVVAPDLSDSAGARTLAEKIRTELAEPVVVGGLTIEVEASVGIAMYPEHGADVETLIRHADVSMYVSKNTHTPIVYAAAYDHHSLARLALVGELRRAIDNNELVVHYQPEADVATGEICKVEALARWHHPERGLLQPDEFIPLAEQTGLIRALTSYVLDAALGQCQAWQRQGRELIVAVNITGRELVDLSFPDEVRKLLTRWGIRPAQLELEITESTIMTDPPRARAVLSGLSTLGVRLAIDDFGSGQSSLGHLRRLPINVLKIDKSFIQKMTEDTGDAAIVRSAIELGHNLGLEVVAEGVETRKAQRHLEALGCDTLQGYYLARPQPASAIAELAGHPRQQRAVS
jgi:diguanylate cyclase (GGDEF)-like protein/PAS domain S-box-containing protein